MAERQGKSKFAACLLIGFVVVSGTQKRSLTLQNEGHANVTGQKSEPPPPTMHFVNLSNRPTD